MNSEHAIDSSQSGLEQFGYKQELKRALSLWDVVIFGLIFAIPLAPFLIFGFVIERSGGMISTVYFAVTIMMLLTANSYARLAIEFPLAGSGYNYVARGASNIIGLFTGFALTIAYVAAPASLYVYAGYALGGVFASVPFWVWILGFVLFNVVLNILGIEATAKVNKVFFAWQMIMLVWFVYCVVAAATGGTGVAEVTNYGFYTPGVPIEVLIAGIGLAAYNFIGVDATTNLAEETKGGVKTAGLGMVLAVAIFGALCVLITYLGTWIIPDWTSIANPDTALYDAALAVGGPPLHWAMTLCMALTAGIACTGCAQSAVARTWYGMSRDKMLPKIFSTIHPKFQTPWVNILIVGVISAGLGLTVRGETLSLFMCFGSLLTFALVNLTAFYYFIIIKKSKNYLWHAVLPLIGAGFNFWVWINLESMIMKAGFTVLGLVVVYLVYLRYVKKINVGLAPLERDLTF